MISQIEYLSIFDVIHNIRSDAKFLTSKETEDQILSSLQNGIIFRNKNINITWQEYNNFITGQSRHYYLICPNCSRNIRKLYIKHKNDGNAQYGCRRCLSIRTSPRTHTQSNKLKNIHHNITQLLTNPSVTSKRREQFISSVIHHYNNINDTNMRTAYFSMTFNIFQKHLLSKLIDRDEGKDYKRAIKEMLAVMRDIKKIIYFS
jgi:hypothetical protein